MNERSLIGSWVRRFLLEHLVSERNLARNTRLSYRDALSLLLPFVSEKQRKPVDRLSVTDLTADLVRSFLSDLETSRRSSIATRNQRLAAVHSLAAFIGAHSPEHIQWCAQVRAVPFKKTTRTVIGYLDKPEMDALLSGPDRRTDLGCRDYALLLFLYNSGARADEAARLTIGDVNLASASVRILGKGGKQRHCPLWRLTVAELTMLIGRRNDSDRVFLNRYGRPMTRFGIHTLVERYAKRGISPTGLVHLRQGTHKNHVEKPNQACCPRAIQLALCWLSASWPTRRCHHDPHPVRQAQRPRPLSLSQERPRASDPARQPHRGNAAAPLAVTAGT
jgi:integrase/recombinase XerD